MKKRQYLIVVIVTVISSFVTNLLMKYFDGSTPVLAREDPAYRDRVFDEIRTRAVYLVDENKKIRAAFYLGMHDAPQLILYDKKDTNRLNFGLAPAGNPGMSFTNGDFSKLIDIDTAYDKPKIVLSDGKKILWVAPPLR